MTRLVLWLLAPPLVIAIAIGFVLSAAPAVLGKILVWLAGE